MRTKNAIYNLIASLLLSITTAISGLILPRLFISSYGSVVNGLLSSIKQFLAYLSLVEAGIGYASMAMLYSPIREKNYQDVNSILSATKIQYRKSGWLFCGLIIVLAYIYPFIVINQIPFKTSFFMIFVLGMSGASEFFLIGKYRVFLTAAQKGYIVYLVQMIGVVINILVTVILVKLNINPVLVQLAASIVFVLRFILLKVYIKKNFDQINYEEKPNTNALSKRWDVLIHQIVNLVLVNMPIIIITFRLGLEEVSVFTVYLLVHNMVVMVLSVFMNGFQAVFGDIISEKNKDNLINSYHLYECLFFTILSITYVSVALLYTQFIKIYTLGISDANYIRPKVAILFVLIGILHNLRLPSMSIMNSAGLFKETKNSAIVEALLSLTLSLVFVHFWGIEGVLLGWLLAYTYRIIILIKQISIDYVYGCVYPTFKIIFLNTVFGITSYFVCKKLVLFEIYNYVDFIINGILCTIVSTIVILTLNIFQYKREWLVIKNKLIRIITERTQLLKAD